MKKVVYSIFNIFLIIVFSFFFVSCSSNLNNKENNNQITQNENISERGDENKDTGDNDRENQNEETNNNTESSDKTNSDNESGNDDTNTNEKILVVYFSCTNNTKNVAEKIVNSINCDVFEIVPSNPYTSDDLNYNNSSCRANLEQNDNSARPQISNSISNIDQYTTIFIGYPIWWGKLPKIIYTFFDTYDFSNKKIIPFCTSGGSSITTSVNEIKSLEPNAIVESGRRFISSVTQSEINSWIESLKIK